jgi:hypothetical protein
VQADRGGAGRALVVQSRQAAAAGQTKNLQHSSPTRDLGVCRLDVSGLSSSLPMLLEKSHGLRTMALSLEFQLFILIHCE